MLPRILLLLAINIASKDFYAQAKTDTALQDTTTRFLYSMEMKVLFLIEGNYSHGRTKENVENLDSITFEGHDLNDLLIIKKGLAVYFIDKYYVVAYDKTRKRIYRLKGFLENDYFWLKQANRDVHFYEFDTPTFKFSNLDKALECKGLYVCPEMISIRKEVRKSLGHIENNKWKILFYTFLSFNISQQVEKKNRAEPPFRPSKYRELSCFSVYYPLFN